MDATQTDDPLKLVADLQKLIAANKRNPLVKWVQHAVIGLLVAACTWLWHKGAELNHKIDQTWRYSVWLHQQTGIPPAPDYIWTEREK